MGPVPALGAGNEIEEKTEIPRAILLKIHLVVHYGVASPNPQIRRRSVDAALCGRACLAGTGREATRSGGTRTTSPGI